MPGKFSWIACAALLAVCARAENEVVLGDESFRAKIVWGDDSLRSRYGPRFDESARVASVVRDGVEFLAEEGLADEFNTRWSPPPGYEDALGAPFLKVGVGALRRNRITPYRFWDAYPVLAEAKTRLVELDSRTAIFEQAFETPSWNYVYRKTYRIDPRAGRLTVRYSLENRGPSPIEVDQYNHNWFSLDPPTPERPWEIETTLEVGPHQMSGTRFWPERAEIFRRIDLPGYATRAQNQTEPSSRTIVSGGEKQVEIFCDFPAKRFSLFVDRSCLAPEIFFSRRILPGRTAEWARAYRFQSGPGLRPFRDKTRPLFPAASFPPF